MPKQEPLTFADKMNRRAFLQRLGLLGVGVAAGGCALADEPGVSADSPSAPLPQKDGKMPMRQLGTTGEKVSILCVGGFHLGRLPSEAEAVRLVREAVDSGVNFLDNAWDYHAGKSERWMGKGIKGIRDKVFLMTKTLSGDRSYESGMRQLEESLERLDVDYLDLWQIHAISDGDAQKMFRKGGVVEALEKAREQGKVRYIGFTGHRSIKGFLDILKEKYPFDACQLPLNCFDYNFKSFEKEVLPELVKQKIGVVAMKSMGGTSKPLDEKAVTVAEAIRYTLSLPVSTLVVGMESLEMLRQNLKIVQEFQPLKTAQMQALRDRVKPVSDGRFEWYKS